MARCASQRVLDVRNRESWRGGLVHVDESRFAEDVRAFLELIGLDSYQNVIVPIAPSIGKRPLVDLLATADIDDLADPEQKDTFIGLYLPCELVALRAEAVVAAFFGWQAPMDIRDSSPSQDPRRVEVLTACGRASDGYCIDAHAEITRHRSRPPTRGEVHYSRREHSCGRAEGALGDAIQCAFDYLARYGDEANWERLADEIMARAE